MYEGCNLFYVENARHSYFLLNFHLARYFLVGDLHIQFFIHPMETGKVI